MTPELARLNLEFLRRVDLRGLEAPALMAVVHACEAIIAEAERLPADKTPGPNDESTIRPDGLPPVGLPETPAN